RVAGLVLLAPGPRATFEVGPLDWIGLTGESGLSVPEALASGRHPPALCLPPSGSGETGCPDKAPGVETVPLSGGHHFGGDFGALAEQILRCLSHTSTAHC